MRKHRTHLRRLTYNYWPDAGFTLLLTTCTDGYLDAESIAFVPTPLGTDAEWRDARRKLAGIIRALRHYCPRVPYNDVVEYRSTPRL